MTAPEPHREVVDVGSVARMMGVDPKTVTKWDKNGKLKAAFRTPGGHRRYYLDDVEKLLPGGS